jgi:hypothetical protein
MGTYFSSRQQNTKTTHIEIVISRTLIWNIPILSVSCNNGIGVAYLHFLAACRARTCLLHDNQWCPRQHNTEFLSCVRSHASTPTDLTVNGKIVLNILLEKQTIRGLHYK